eukprot:5529265-Pleurochrysis_carterae.AAC.1
MADFSLDTGVAGDRASKRFEWVLVTLNRANQRSRSTEPRDPDACLPQAEREAQGGRPTSAHDALRAAWRMGDADEASGCRGRRNGRQGGGTQHRSSQMRTACRRGRPPRRNAWRNAWRRHVVLPG